MDPSVAPGSLLGEQLEGRYRLLRVISHDGGTEVYEAEDERLQRRVELHVSEGGATDVATLGAADQAGMLDAGQHDGHAFVVFALTEPAPATIVGTGPGDDEPTRELPTPADHTAVLPVPLVPAADPSDAPPDAGPGAAAVLAGRLWARRAVLIAVAAVLLVVLAGLAARNDGVEVPTDSTVAVTSTTTIAPTTTTTTPPTTEAPAEGRGRGKGKKGDGED